MAGGDLISGKYSIGGADDRVPNTIGQAGGIDKHGVFEIDGSITRQDTYFGNNANFILQRWEEYVAIANKNGGDFGAQTQAQDRVCSDMVASLVLAANLHGLKALRYDNSRATNPEFFAGVKWFAGKFCGC